MPPESRNANMSETKNITSQSQSNVPSLKCSGTLSGGQVNPCGRQGHARQDTPRQDKSNQAGPRQTSLHGKRILVTRTREQAHALSERLQAVGAIPVEFPTIRIVPPQNWEQLDSALGKLFLA